jgi:hypothetical protein
MHVGPDRTDVGTSFSKYLLLWFNRLWSDFWPLATLFIAVIVDIFIGIAKPFSPFLKKMIQPEEGKDGREWLIKAAILVFALLLSWFRVAYLLYRDRDTNARKNERRLSEELHKFDENLRSCRHELASKAPRITIAIKELYALAEEQGVPIWPFTPVGQSPRRKTAATLDSAPGCVVAMRLQLSNTGPSSNIISAELSIEAATGPIVANEFLDPSQFRLRRYEVLHMSRGPHTPEPGETIIIRRIPRFLELEGDLTRYVEGVKRPQLNSNQVEFGWLVFRVRGADADIVNRSVVKFAIVDAHENTVAVESSPDQARAATGSELVSAADASLS